MGQFISRHLVSSSGGLWQPSGAMAGQVPQGLDRDGLPDRGPGGLPSVTVTGIPQLALFPR